MTSIFVVDDNLGAAEGLSAVLGNAGYSSQAFDSAVGALEALRSQTPDMVISDLWMPYMDGVDLGKAVKARHPNCRFLLITGLPWAVAARADASQFKALAKPVHPEELLAQVRSELGSPQQQN